MSEIKYLEGYKTAWISQLIGLHNKTEMQRSNADRVGAAFSSSHTVITVWLENHMVGCGRMLSDGHMYSSIFDVVVDPDFQRQGIGREIMTRLLAKTPHACVHLTSTIGNEDFYAKLGFRKHKTAMALYPEGRKDSPYLERLPPGLEKTFLPQPRLETARLVLEPYKDSDLDDILAYASNEEVTRFLSWEAHKTLEDSRQFLEWVRDTTSEEIGKIFFVFAIRLKETGRVIGTVDFKNPKPWIGQIDYVLGLDHWGQGIMPEAAAALRDWSLNQFPDMVRLQSYCETENKASARVMEKIGMKFEGIRRKSFKARGRIIDLADYALIR